MAKDGAAWSEADDALLAMGLLKWGAINDTIAADLLPGYTGNSVGQRVADCTHRQQPPNIVKVLKQPVTPTGSLYAVWQRIAVCNVRRLALTWTL